MDTLNKDSRSRKRLGSVLALVLDGNRLEGAVLRRSNGSAQVLQTFSATLSLDPLTAAPELVGRELRNLLDGAGVKERHCVFGLPLKWILTTQTEVPELAAADVTSFLALEAERNFPCDPATLQVCQSTCQPQKGARFVTLAGIPRNHAESIEAMLRAARLKPVSFSLGITALQPPTAPESQGVLALLVGETQVNLQVSLDGGIAALRTLEGVLETQGGRKELHPDAVGREARITLGQLPAELREKVRKVRVFGPRDLAQQLADEIELRFEPQGLRAEVVTQFPPDAFGFRLPEATAVSPAVSLAARALGPTPAVLEFLPKHLSTARLAITRYTTGKWRMAAAIAVLLTLLLGGLFGVQQFQLTRLNSQWHSMSDRAQELAQLQEKIRQFRPWHNDSLGGLNILRQITLAFPEDNSVSAKAIEIRDLSTVTCSGVARDNPALLKTLDKLRASGGIKDLKVSQIRGKNPLQFTFDFRWNERDEN